AETQDPDTPEDQRKAFRTSFMKFVNKAPGGKAAAASSWSDADAAGEQQVEYLHCWTEADANVYEYGPLTTDNKVPSRFIRIIEIPSGGGYLAYIRTDKKTNEFLFCDNLQVSAILGESFIEGDCTFRPHGDGGKHFVIFNARFSSATRHFDSIYFGYYDEHPDPNGGTQVHNGDAHGGST